MAHTVCIRTNLRDNKPQQLGRRCLPDDGAVCNQARCRAERRIDQQRHIDDDAVLAGAIPEGHLLHGANHEDSLEVDHRRGDHVEGDGPEAVTPQEGHEEAKADKNLVGGGGGGGRVALCT